MAAAAAAAADSDRCECGFVNMILIIMIVVLLGGFFALSVIYYSYFPYTAEFGVTDASLTEYNLTTNNNRSTLHYDLDLNFTVRNSNEEYGIYYDGLQVMAYYLTQEERVKGYHGRNPHMLGIGNLSSFYQGKKNTTHLTLSLKLGQLRLDHVLCNHDGAIGYHDIEVMLHFRRRYEAKYTWKGTSDITCLLEVPLISYNSRSQSANTGTSNFCTTPCYSEEDFPMLLILPGIIFVLSILFLCLGMRLPE